MNTERAVKEFIISEYAPEASPDELDATYDLLDTGLVNSLGLLRLIGWVGKTFDIPVDDIEISPDDFRTVAAICAFVEGAPTGRH
ncbi:acyl carrier protein [Streptomyces sp. NPDC003077]|uniref:acyl carrier protein n=1 Tax=Streptomyces sp. NPDC003077 TaxID=3154443 RepID=UPI0033BD12D6